MSYGHSVVEGSGFPLSDKEEALEEGEEMKVPPAPAFEYSPSRLL